MLSEITWNKANDYLRTYDHICFCWKALEKLRENPDSFLGTAVQKLHTSRYETVTLDSTGLLPSLLGYGEEHLCQIYGDRWLLCNKNTTEDPYSATARTKPPI